MPIQYFAIGTFNQPLIINLKILVQCLLNIVFQYVYYYPLQRNIFTSAATVINKRWRHLLILLGPKVTLITTICGWKFMKVLWEINLKCFDMSLNCSSIAWKWCNLNTRQYWLVWTIPYTYLTIVNDKQLSGKLLDDMRNEVV